jgi:hypothetical protein
MKRFTIIILSLLAIVAATPASARRLNDKVDNLPYADMRRWHLGFSIGGHVDDLRFAHNGCISDEGEQWRMDQPSYSPGFSVTGLVDFRLNNMFSLRFSPGMMFGSRDIRFHDANGVGADERQNIKSTYVVLPVDLKFASMRTRNARPYVLTGVMPLFDVSKKRSDILKLDASDFYLSVGFGCDFYLPYFKLIPEVKFCFGLADILTHDRPDLVDDPTRIKYTNSLSKATSKMIVFSFYFE